MRNQNKKEYIGSWAVQYILNRIYTVFTCIFILDVLSTIYQTTLCQLISANQEKHDLIPKWLYLYIMNLAEINCKYYFNFFFA